MIQPLLKPKERGKNYGKRLLPDERGVIVHPDGREVCDTRTARGRAEYQRRRRAMFVRQGGICSWCNLPMRLSSCTFDHSNGRGSNKQDDRIEIGGKPYNSAMHMMCNYDKGSKRT